LLRLLLLLLLLLYICEKRVRIEVETVGGRDQRLASSVRVVLVVALLML